MKSGLFKKGNTPWNKGTKKLIKANSGSFKKGQRSWNKEKPKQSIRDGKRICRKCGNEKELDYFTKDKTCCFGRSYTCKRCTTDYANERYANGLIYLKKGRFKLTDKQRAENIREAKKRYEVSTGGLKNAARQRQDVKNLTDKYVINLLTKHDSSLKSTPPELIKAKRQHIKTKRLITQRKKELKECHN